MCVHRRWGGRRWAWFGRTYARGRDLLLRPLHHNERRFHQTKSLRRARHVGRTCWVSQHKAAFGGFASYTQPHPCVLGELYSTKSIVLARVLAQWTTNKQTPTSNQHHHEPRFPSTVFPPSPPLARPPCNSLPLPPSPFCLRTQPNNSLGVPAIAARPVHLAVRPIQPVRDRRGH